MSKSISKTEEVSEFTPIPLDFKKIRKDRKQINENKCKKLINDIGIKKMKEICDSSSKYKSKTFFNKHGINHKEIIRKFKEYSIEFLLNCEKENAFIFFIKSILIKETRQCSLDEKFIIEILDNVNPNISITKSSNIRSNKNDGTMIKSNKKLIDYLKSYDFEITGINKRKVACKITYGEGGHQDNVNEELINYINWWKKYGDKHHDKYFIILFITDLHDMKNKLSMMCSGYEKINVFDEVELQMFLHKM